MDIAPKVSFRKEVLLIELTDGQFVLEFPWGKASLNRVTAGVSSALRTLSAGGATESDLNKLVINDDGLQALGVFYYYFQSWQNLCLLQYFVLHEDRFLAIATPIASDFEFVEREVGIKTRFRLSRFAYFNRQGDTIVIESPLSLARTTIVEHVGTALLAELAQPRSYPDLHARVPGLTRDTTRAFVSLLASVDIIAEVDEDGSLGEERDPALAQWEFHDLLFHSRSRLGRHDYPAGGIFPFRGRFQPLPRTKPKMSDSAIPLYSPDIESLKLKDLTFTQVLESRKSVRLSEGPQITAEQLGEFLYRVARVRRVIEPNTALGIHYQISDRPYPSGGAAFDLELYLTISIGLSTPSGIYHYDPLRHELHKLSDCERDVKTLLREAERCTGSPSPPQVLITLTSRFQRLSWKYRGIAYATTLKNVGVLYQTMYLVATAMNLAGCALGAGNSAVFSKALNIDFFKESSVGEFILAGR